MFSCDYVDEPLEKIEGGFNDRACTTPIFPTNTNTKRNILIEDFTGHTCTGCPGAAYTLEQLEQTHGKQVIGIAMHAGFFSQPLSGQNKFETDFRSTDGNDIHDDFGPISSYPKGMINRSDTVLNNNDFLFAKEQFGNAVNVYLNQAPAANLQMVTAFNDNDRTLCVFVETDVLTDLTGNHNLVIALTEDSITDWQKNGGGSSGNPNYPTGDVSNYRHNHVLRDNMNGTYGENIIASSYLASDTNIISKYTATVDASWNVDNLNVIAYLVNMTTKEIIQVTKEHAK